MVIQIENSLNKIKQAILLFIGYWRSHMFFLNHNCQLFNHWHKWTFPAASSGSGKQARPGKHEGCWQAGLQTPPDGAGPTHKPISVSTPGIQSNMQQFGSAHSAWLLQPLTKPLTFLISWVLKAVVVTFINPKQSK